MQAEPIDVAQASHHGIGISRAALRVSWLSIVWSAASGCVSLTVGVGARSLALIGAGVIVLIDLSSSAVLVWRFRQHHEHPRAERVAYRAATGALFLLALGLAAGAVVRLGSGGAAQPSVVAVAASSLSLFVLPLIAVQKYRIAQRARSRALRMDGHITLVGAATNLVTLAGLAFTVAGWRGADPGAALVVALAAALVGVSEVRLHRRGEQRHTSAGSAVS